MFGTSALFGQIRWDALTSVAADDPAMPAIRTWQQTLQAKFEKSGAVRVTFSSSFELPFTSLKALFPRHRFFAMQWSEFPVPGQSKKMIGLALGMEITLVCDLQGKFVQELPQSGNYEGFGTLLAANRVPIRNDDDAKLVWEAFCDVHQRHWKKDPVQKISETVWHLGNTTIDGIHYFYEVTLDADQVVRAAKLRSEHLSEQPTK